jgi:hypothetical protein
VSCVSIVSGDRGRQYNSLPGPSQAFGKLFDV